MVKDSFETVTLKREPLFVTDAKKTTYNQTLTNNRLLSMQCIRGLAALLVFLVHLSTNYNLIFKEKWANGVLEFSTTPVDIFFALSGFTIFRSSSHLMGEKKALNFITARIIRIYPIYWISISYLIFYRLLRDPNFDWSGLMLLKSISAWPQHYMFNGVSWSLSHEMYFYLLFSLAIWKRSFTSIGILIGIVSLIHYLQPDLFTSDMGEFLFHKRNLMFAAGALLALYINKLPNIPKLTSIIIFSICLLGCCIWATNVSSNNWNLVVYVLIAVLAIASLLKLERSLNSSWLKPLVEIGNASYPLYLIHLPLTNGFLKLIYQKQVTPELRQYSIIVFILFMLLLSYAFHIFLERPITQYLKERKDQYNLNALSN